MLFVALIGVKKRLHIKERKERRQFGLTLLSSDLLILKFSSCSQVFCLHRALQLLKLFCVAVTILQPGLHHEITALYLLNLSMLFVLLSITNML